MYDVITFGSATRDVFVRSSEFETHACDHSPSGMDCCFPLGSKVEISDLIMDTGGGGTNAAVTFGRLGHKTGAAVCVGKGDASGHDILSVLKSNGVSDEFVQKYEKDQTAFSLVVLVGSGERTILVYRGASSHLSADQIPWSKAKAKWFYITSLSGRLELIQEIMDHAEKNDIKIAWNPGSKELKYGLKKLEPLIRKATIFNLNLEEAMRLLDTDDRDINKLLIALKGLTKQAIIITDGIRGAYAADSTKTWHSNTIDCPRINVTGAGDAFGSGLVAGLMKKNDLPYGMAVGTWNATGVVQATGAKRHLISKYPSDKDIARVEIKEIEI
ncbi:MAG: carbohydrate kinase family protein [candidate division Zixibacteria bacterium]|nr:carbohydrate kinase family protein [candidate division Zixibacteria bacterium]